MRGLGGDGRRCFAEHDFSAERQATAEPAVVHIRGPCAARVTSDPAGCGTRDRRVEWGLRSPNLFVRRNRSARCIAHCEPQRSPPSLPFSSWWEASPRCTGSMPAHATTALIRSPTQSLRLASPSALRIWALANRISAHVSEPVTAERPRRCRSSDPRRGSPIPIRGSLHRTVSLSSSHGAGQPISSHFPMALHRSEAASRDVRR